METWPASRCEDETLMRHAMAHPEWSAINRETRAEVVRALTDTTSDGDEVRATLRRAVAADRRLAAVLRRVESQTRNNLGHISFPTAGPDAVRWWKCPRAQCGERLPGDLDGPFGPIRCAQHGDQALELVP